MKCPFAIKICRKCKKILVAYKGNFCKKKDGKWGIDTICRLCKKEEKKQYREENKERIKEYQKKYHEQYYKEHQEEIKENRKRYKEENKEKVRESNKKYYQSEKGKNVREKYRKEYYEKHKEELQEYGRQYAKKYEQDNPDKIFNKNSKRRLIKEQQGNGITKEQWLEMMNFFDWCCAYSGVYIGGDSENRTIDHIICLNKGGLNEIWNVVPMYKNYNSSKGTKDILEWYMEQSFFDINKLLKIYEWIEYAFNKWGD